MSEEKCKYCGGEIGYIGMPYGFTCLNRNCITHNDKEFIQELKQQLQTAKEENEKLTQQNKQMREALEFIKTKYEPYIAYLQVVEDINKIMTALKGVE